jgi:phospholipid/cholesterol/gamma-HCH transport system substrate-binding protein
MRNDKRNYLLVGTFVIAMLVALIVWIAMVSGRTGATDDYYILYDNVMGLNTGVEILFEGYPVGLIEDIAPVDDQNGHRRYRVDVSVQRGWPLPVDSRATIMAPGLLSAFVINIKGGKSATLIEPGSEIPGVEAADMMAAMTNVAQTVNSILDEQFKPLMDQIAETVPEVVDDVEAISSQMRGSVEKIDTLLSPGNVDRVSNILKNLETATGTADELLAELGSTKKNIDSMIDKLNGMMKEDDGELNKAIEDLHYTLDSVARRIDSITSNLEMTMRNMNEFSGQIRDNPGVLVRGRDSGSDQ